MAKITITIEDTDRAVRDAGHLYLISTHVATLFIFAFFALLHDTTGSYAFLPVAPGVAGSAGGAVLFLLALAGFGLKAGMMPLHVWLPSAHANAPSHVSALMSGVLIKTGIYGLFRFLLLFPDPPAWWGGTVGGGSTITKDTPPGALSIGRGRQLSIANWKRPRK